MRSLLVANRGEIACRIFGTARAMGIETVAVFSDPDERALHVRDADIAVRLAGSTATDTYLRGELVVAAALAAGADAVHPGYGFLSENAGFAQQVIDAGLIWVGPPPAAIEAMGSKLVAKQMMRAAGVPTLPWTESVDAATEIGFPLLVKASAGGGGRGMRIVRQPAELAAAVEAAEREAAGAFGDATVFLERYLESPRHVEVQVMADRHGTTVSLFERECSIQRRHQKIVEESPSPAVDDALRSGLGQAAVRAARAVGYVGAGTVEFVLAADGSYHFLEMNTRLQVEHPVTELVTGLDLVRLQLLIAAGEPLPSDAAHPTARGHAIEVRLYAEDPLRDFVPATGTLRSFEVSDGVRVDTGVVAGSVVSPYYDPMLAKLVAHAPSRREAALRLAAALAGARVHGVTTNRDLLAAILREPEFLAGRTDTGYLDRHPPQSLLTDERRCDGALALAAALAWQASNRRQATVLSRLPSGWRNNPSQPQAARLLTAAGDEVVVAYRFDRDRFVAQIDGQPLDDVVVYDVAPERVDLAVAGVRIRYRVAVDGGTGTVDVDSAGGSAEFTVAPRFPDPQAGVAAGSLVAPMPGSVVRVLVEPGVTVIKGQPLVILEAMKMEHTVASPTDGEVTAMRVVAGQQVDAGAVLAVVE